MKYLGKKSLSSFMSRFLKVMRHVVLVLAIIAPVAIIAAILYSTPLGDRISSEMAKSKICAMDGNTTGVQDEDGKEWDKFKSMPLVLKLLILPYCEAVLLLLLQIITKSRLLFDNFKNDVVFNKNNVVIISQVSKLTIAFSIITFSFSSLLISIVLFLLCEIIKNGTVLQEEHDLTV
jgi:hypothetical protein